MSSQAAPTSRANATLTRLRENEDRIADWLHWALLVAAFVFIVVISRHRYFTADEWGPVVDRTLFGGHGTQGLFVPNNEHWIFFPALADRLLFSVFAVRTHLPYSVLDILSHLALVQLLWMLLRRIGVSSWVALAAIAGFVFVGAGYENVISAFEVDFVWSVAAGLGALLVAPLAGTWSWRRDLLASALLIFGVASSGVGLAMLFVVALVQLIRRGWRVAAVVAAPPVVIYLVWYSQYRQQAQTAGQLPLGTAIQRLPAFVWSGLTEPISTTFELAGVGVVAIVLLAIWTIRHSEPFTEPWPLVLSMALGAPVFLALTGLARVQFGVVAATTPRYSYVALALLLPLAALGADAVLARVPLRSLVIVVGIAMLLVVGASQLKQHSDQETAVEREQEFRIVAAARIARTTKDFLVPFPVPYLIPVLTMSRLHQLDVKGQLPKVATTPADELTALEYLQVFLGSSLQLSAGRPEATILDVSGATVAPNPRPGCVDVTATSSNPMVRVAFTGAESMAFTPQRSGAASIVFERGGASGRVRRLTPSTDANAPGLTGGRTATLNVDAPGTQALIGVPDEGSTTLCNVGLS